MQLGKRFALPVDTRRAGLCIEVGVASGRIGRTPEWSYFLRAQMVRTAFSIDKNDRIEAA
jgi:hypothetical protein